MRKILFIGAGFLQKFLIQKAKEIGNITLAVDANPNAVGYQYADKHATIDIIDQEACLRYAQEQNVDGVVTAATDFGVLTASYIAQKLHLPGLSYHTACQVKNKYLVHKRLFDSHADDAKRAYEVSTLNEIAGLEFQLDYPVMVKPCDGSGSRGASKVKCHKDLEDACRLASVSYTHLDVYKRQIQGRHLRRFPEGNGCVQQGVLRGYAQGRRQGAGIYLPDPDDQRHQDVRLGQRGGGCCLLYTSRCV